MTGLLDPTLKHTDEFRLRQQNVLSGICMFKVSKAKKKKKKVRNMSNIFKVNNKDTRTTSGASITIFEHISHF